MSQPNYVLHEKNPFLQFILNLSSDHFSAVLKFLYSEIATMKKGYGKSIKNYTKQPKPPQAFICENHVKSLLVKELLFHIFTPIGGIVAVEWGFSCCWLGYVAFFFPLSNKYNLSISLLNKCCGFRSDWENYTKSLRIKLIKVRILAFYKASKNMNF